MEDLNPTAGGLDPKYDEIVHRKNTHRYQTVNFNPEDVYDE
jgi:hypothetical protein